MYLMGLFTACSGPQKIEEMTDKAFTISKFVVQKMLKSPSTAKFPHIADRAEYLQDSLFGINSYVDSQNGFGAIVRSKYAIVLYYKGGDWADINNWEIKNLSIDGKNLISPNVSQ